MLGWRSRKKTPVKIRSCFIINLFRFSHVVEQLKEVVMECSIRDADARQFWRSNWGTQEHSLFSPYHLLLQNRVEWHVFSVALRKYLNRPSTFWLKALMGSRTFVFAL